MEYHESPVINQESLTKPIETSISTKASEKHPLSNEDNSFAKEKKDGTVTFGVFDGMGGIANGKESSNFCLSAVESQMDGISPTTSPQDIGEKLRTISEDVNDEFLGRKGELKLGGSTGVFGMIVAERSGSRTAVIANIGDSRAYVFRNGELIRITTDDSQIRVDYPNNFAKMQNHIDEASSYSELTDDEAEAFRTRNVITGCFGNPSVRPEIITFPLEQGDILLVTTDGIHDNLTTTEIRNILDLQKRNGSSEISKSIVNSSVRRSQERSFRSKADDMTALVIKIGESSTPTPKEEISSPQPSPDSFIPQINQEVNVQRSSGLVESGWVIKFINKDGIVVHKKEENGVINIKTLPFDKLERFNRPAKPDDIVTAQDFNQLLFTLSRLDGVQGTERFYSRDYLINVIQKYLKGEASLENIPRSNELRDTVQKLFSSKRNKSNT